VSAPVRPIPLLALAALLSAGCNRYAMFNVAGYEQATFSNDADILFVVDNSASMAEETSALALNFNVFIDTLASAQGATPATETLSDAVDNYVVYTSQRGKFLDYNLALTTTSVDYAGGVTPDVDDGEAGLLLGDPKVVAKGTAGESDLFRRNLLCDAIPWNSSDLPSDPSYTCGADPGGVITQEYLDCECGLGEWENDSGSGQEEPLEAALMALCRSVEEPPEACYDPLSPFAGSESQKNEGFLREEGTVVVVVVTDEGDNSRRLPQGEADPQPYLDALADFPKPVKLVAIGPNWDPAAGEVKCASTAVPTWSVDRLQSVAAITGGFYKPIAVEGASGDCEPSNFAEHLEDLGALLQNLTTAFQLQSIPDIGTIRVWVDDEEIDTAPILNADVEDQEPIYGDGWTYDSAQNAIVFWGKAIPDYNAEVRIYYRPLEGKPRELPF
jgi:hypothetical protein